MRGVILSPTIIQRCNLTIISIRFYTLLSEMRPPIYPSVFPPARLKRIIQSNSDVGKLAIVVPILFARAVECFVRDVVGKVDLET